MSRIVVGAAVVVVTAVGAAFYAQSRATAALRRDIATLRDEVRIASAAAKAEATKARVQSADTSGAPAVVKALPGMPADEMAKLRDDIAALRKTTSMIVQFAQTAQAAKDLAKTSDSVATKLTPANELKNAGRATPEASTETALWAAVGGDVDVLAGSLTFTDSARAKADAWFAGLSDSVRQQYGSPEKVIALMIARDAAGLAGMQVLGQKEIGANDVGVRLRFASVDGKVKDDTLLMHRSTEGWKMLLPDQAVEKFAKQVGGGK